MPQISLYIDKETLYKIEKIAHKNHTSISKWVGSSIKNLIKDDYPENYFSLFGSINDETFQKPSSLDLSQDVRRENI